MKVKRAAKYGFCSGVRVADIKVKRFASKEGRGAILGQLVHNERVVEEMRHLGVRTVEKMEDVTEPVVVFSAHGVAPSVQEKAKALGLEILDTTCKFVYDIHKEAKKALEEGAHLVFIGDPRHREVIGYTNDLEESAYHVINKVEQAEAVDWSRYPSVKILYQTTINSHEYEAVVQAIERRAKTSSRADTICYATKQNQDAALQLASDPEVEAVIVVGGKKSANTRHLWEICRETTPSYLVQGPEGIDPTWFEGMRCVGLTAGSSTPDYVLEEVEAFLAAIESAGKGSNRIKSRP